MPEYLVVGGGIAAVQCVEELARLCPNDAVTLVSATSRIKGIQNVSQITRNVEEFEIVEKDLAALPYPNVRSIQATATGISTAPDKHLTLADGSSVPFTELCVCTGATPKVVYPHPLVLVLRDRDTVADLSKRLQSARRVVIVGNGGIATELAYSLKGIGVVWAVKHSHICDAFLDADAAAFLATKLGDKQGGGSSCCSPPAPESCSSSGQLPKPAIIGADGELKSSFGHSVGPLWAAKLSGGVHPGSLQLEANYTLREVVDSPEGADWPITVELSNGRRVEADFVISAVGVTPNTQWLGDTLALEPADRGILIDWKMESYVPGIFAAGDACAMPAPSPDSHWFQMRLWTQAKVMGTYAAHCMAGTQESAGLAFNFELFTHVTRFLGQKVVLLGSYNGQNIPESRSDDLVSYSRSTEGPNGNFVRVMLLSGKMVGAVLIGETDLEETFENLILDGLDLSCYGPELLDPDIELDHMFD